MTDTKPAADTTPHESLHDHVHGPDCRHDHEHHDHYVGSQPLRRELPKIGRNEPCPCGSGKKFKKCHGSVDRADQ